ncbi:MAG: hypothetical protein ABSE86_05255 [Bryobacteraceae bacterium]|jgi:hypothetical protein
MLESIRDSASVQIVLLVSVTIALLGVGFYFLSRMRRNPKDKEKRRRLQVNQQGRLGDATITEVQENTIFYEYSVRRVLYTASQDVAQLREQMPGDLERLIGPVTLKYSPQNPANSILLCEEWSGLRGVAPAKPLTAT